MSLLGPEDVTYMQETQADARPTQATWFQVAEQPDGAGGYVTGSASGVSTMVRFVSREGRSERDRIPAAVADRYDVTSLTKIVCAPDVVPTAGDQFRDVETDRDYQVVTNGETDEWTTAVVVYAIRTDRPQEVAG